MNAKRWFAWVCLALMLVAEIFLFRANHERDAALARLHAKEAETLDVQAKLDALQNSAAGAQASEISSLRKQNEVLAAKVKDLQGTVSRLQSEKKQTEEHLSTARNAIELQQEHLQQLQAQQQQAAAIANAAACIANLRSIDAAKAQWALDKDKGATDVPTAQDLLPYFKDGVFPLCPEGGTYTINSMGTLPTCTVQGHVLTQGVLSN